MAEGHQSSRCYVMLFQSCLTCYEPHQNEALYHGLLRCLLHPLGAPDTEIGLRPGDLVHYVRQVFDIDQGDHDRFVREQLHNKPKKIQVRTTVIEAKDLEIEETLSNEHAQCNTYCLLSLVNPAKGPRYPVSPRSSPRSSPLLRRRTPRDTQAEKADVLRSQPAKGFAQPKWNEEFNLEIEDFNVDELYICFVVQETETALPGDKQPDKINKLKSFIRNVLTPSDAEDTEDIPGCIGRIVMSVRDIPNTGIERWVNIYPVGPVTSRTKPVGHCRLRVAISYMQTECFSVEDYHQLSIILHKHAAMEDQDTYDSSLMLAPKSRRILDIFATANGISKLSQAILDLTVLLELVASPAKDSEHLLDWELHGALEEVQMTWFSLQACCSELSQRMPLSDSEISLYRSATRNYINYLTSKLHEMPSLFPPSAESLITLKGSFGLAIHLLELDLWDASSSPLNDLADKLLNKLQCDIDEWITEKLEAIYAHRKVKDSVIPEVEALTETIDSLISHCSPLGVITQFYGPLGVKYYRVVAFRTERKVSSITKELMLEMDKYLLRYHSFPVNISHGSRLSLSLYFTIRKFYQLTTEGLADRDMVRLTIGQYQRWFQESLVFWLQTFKTECMTRMEKALEIDKDVVLVTSMVKFSNSSVDVLSCFAKITEEWRKIDFVDPDSAAMGVTKITDMICDGARLYADIIHAILERNCYYHSKEDQFDCTERLCITLNNIEHVRQYLDQLPELLQWAKIADTQSGRYEDTQIGQQSMSTLKRLTSTAHHDILMKSYFLLREIAVKMKVNVQKLMQMFIVKSPEKAAGVDKTIGYLSTNLRTLEDRLMASIYPKMIEELWEIVQQIFYEQMKIGKKTDYYEHLTSHLHALYAFFLSCGLEETDLEGLGKSQLRSRLELNCLKTEQLMKDYFQQLASAMKTPSEYLGHLAIKIAYVEETENKVSIIVKVMEALDLPGLDHSGLSDPYVLVSLQPPCLFKGIKAFKTKIVDQTLNPVFNEMFKFPKIPAEQLMETGACVVLSVLDYDIMVSDDFVGEVVYPMSNIQAVMNESQIDAMPAVMLPLNRPQRVPGGPLQVLEERGGWDKEAKQFVVDRMRYIENQRQRCDRDQTSDTRSLFSYFGLKNTGP